MFRIRNFLILIFNLFLLSLLVLGVAGLFIKFRILGYITIGLAISILLLLTFAETALRNYNQKHNVAKSVHAPSPHREMLEHVLNEIPNSPFSTRAFLMELDDYYKQGLTRKINQIRTSTDYNGFYIKITDGIRSGISPSSIFDSKIFVLGGSTVSCLECPDEWTLPSQIQNQLNKFKILKKVINLGVSGATTSDRFIAASDQKSIQSDDTLFFWFGVNEGKGLWGRRARGILGFWPGFIEMLSLARKYSKSSIINWLYLELIRFDESSHRRLARARANELRRSFDKEFKKWALKGVRVIAGLQPTIFSASSNVFDREYLAKNWKPEMMTIMNIQYEEFRSSFKGANYFNDFSDATNDDPKNSFVDWVHLSWLGNRAVAEKIYKSGIFTEGSAPSQF